MRHDGEAPQRLAYICTVPFFLQGIVPKSWWHISVRVLMCWRTARSVGMRSLELFSPAYAQGQLAVGEAHAQRGVCNHALC